MDMRLAGQVYWARWDGGARWTIALHPQTTVGTWLRQTYQIAWVGVLPSGAIAVRLYATSQTNGLLLQLPKPRWGGSRHESNLIRWP